MHCFLVQRMPLLHHHICCQKVGHCWKRTVFFRLSFLYHRQSKYNTYNITSKRERNALNCSNCIFRQIKLSVVHISCNFRQNISEATQSLRASRILVQQLELTLKIWYFLHISLQQQKCANLSALNFLGYLVEEIMAILLNSAEG